MKLSWQGSLLAAAALTAALAANADIIERVIARVNGEIVTQSDFEARQLNAVQAAQVPATEVEAFLRQNNAKILEEAMDELLLVDRAAAIGLKLRPEYLDQYIEDIKKEQNITSEEEFSAQLKREGLTRDALRRNIERSVMVRQLRSREIDPKAQVSEADVRAEYERRKNTEFTRKATVHLLEIVLKGPGAAERASALVERLKKGEDFETLAREYSTSASQKTGGDLGRVEPRDLNPALAAAIESLRPGDVSAPVEIDGSYWVLKVTQRMADQVTPYDEVKEKLREEMSQAKFEKVYADYIADLKKNAVYTVFVREVPTTIGRQKQKAAVPAATDDEITTVGPSGPQRTVVPGGAVPAAPSPTPLPPGR